jgi:hypothetical protein
MGGAGRLRQKDSASPTHGADHSLPPTAAAISASMISLRSHGPGQIAPVVCSGLRKVRSSASVVADSAFRYAKMFGDFLGGFFRFGERASSGIPHNFSGEIHRSDFFIRLPWASSSACIFEKGLA